MEEGEVPQVPSKRRRSKGSKAHKNSRSKRPAPQSSTKSIPCKFYIEGRCHKGLDCHFSHQVTQIQKQELCKFYLTGCCAKGQECVYSHDTKAFPCKYYHANGHCQGGEQCRFSHERLKCWEIPKFVEDNLAFLKEIRERTGTTHLGEFLDMMIREQSIFP